MFDKKSGKKLPYDADVKVGHEYYLVIGRTLNRNIKTIEQNEVCSKIISLQTWRVYEIKATQFNEEAAKFFLNFHYRLTDEPVTMYPIWPSYIEAPYIIYHNSKQINVFFNGNAEPKLSAVGDIVKYPISKPKLLCITSDSKHQLLSAGRTAVLKYMYFWQSEIDKNGIIPSIKVVDIRGNEISNNKKNELPENQTLCVTSDVDGKFIVLEGGYVLEKYELYAGNIFEYDRVRYGITIKIYQGLDCIWSSFYERKKIDKNYDEMALLNDLIGAGGKKIKISHSIGAIIDKFNNQPKIKAWIYKTIKKGYIQENAYKLLRRYIKNKLGDV